MKNFNFSEDANVVVNETSVDMNAIKLLGNAWHLGAYFNVSFENTNEKAIIKISTNINTNDYDPTKLAKDFSVDVDAEGKSINIVLRALESSFDKGAIVEYLNHTNLKSCSVDRLLTEILEYCAMEDTNIQFMGRANGNHLYQITFENGKIDLSLSLTMGLAGLLDGLGIRTA